MDIKLNLYLVARYGNDEEGPDGKDTVYLIRVTTFLQAVALAEASISRYTEKNVLPYANWVCEIGVDKGIASSPDIKARFMI